VTLSGHALLNALRTAVNDFGSELRSRMKRLSSLEYAVLACA
jgi:succinate dehydrogenase/fumarate reductase cytochrome b subunit